MFELITVRILVPKGVAVKVKNSGGVILEFEIEKGHKVATEEPP